MPLSSNFALLGLLCCSFHIAQDTRRGGMVKGSQAAIAPLTQPPLRLE
jgi:hypothetical protein